ncbi:Spx/MgsR family RNA polymerase-binding regulatory protein [Lactococcus taiwanensis]|uniref:Spx/MgsR family RNA polymerase-binding regulatory protein n=1 Tax=Lactococcus taiwanensis TaxID=1151742 RepID=UPI0028B1056C|nr:Spx/MgsR family RNA polymerase-binding regulatory protein [Lactococcus taiwanensis]
MTSSCASCRKARRWLQENGLPFNEINIKTSLTKQDLIDILTHTDKGTEDIISTHCELYKQLNLDFTTMKFNEFIKTIETYPLLIKRPIIMDESNIQIGFNEEDIRVFLPQELRTIQRLEILEERWFKEVSNSL